MGSRKQFTPEFKREAVQLLEVAVVPLQRLCEGKFSAMTAAC
jgi:transposase-like protein